MSRLFSYTLRYDDGAAPNPFGGVCSLAICKPGIRRVARVGDWVVGLGSSNAPSGDLSGHLVYAMCVDQVLTLKEYDQLSSEKLRNKIPNIKSLDLISRLGDCIYDYSDSLNPVQREGVHGPGNVKTDLSGENVLLSEDFYYFGSNAIKLPKNLKPIIHQTQGHKSNSNSPYFNDFVQWIRGLGHQKGQLYGWPDFIVSWSSNQGCNICTNRQKDDECDIAC